ncbi:MAG: NADH:ubiquinone reductase (Na(+)-transporting) subunit B [Bacteroidales bacterium]|nr:NADH:ubiquinone reductase (Na(+)-transporting) subunit B [Bacteroidales bacterium]NLM92536.1 NADH:ubiquinone reductase (Na(+)-transporting) subunit B [Bacteroidales bacterium]
MKALIQFVENKIQPNFEKGGKFHKFHRSFEAFQTFLYVKGDVTRQGSHIRDAVDMKRTMFHVVIALTPVLLFGMWNAGLQHYRALGMDVSFWNEFWFGFLRVLPIVVVSYVVGLAVEFIFAEIRNHEVNEGFLVSGMLIPLIVPVTTPLWMVALATIFAVIIGKEVFGGTGMNILNPALLARAFLFFAYPAFMSGEIWINTTLREGQALVDGFSGATPLAMLAANEVQNLPSVLEMFLGTIPGSIGETSTLAILIGALILIATGVGSLRIILSVVVGGLFMGLLLNLFSVNEFMAIPPYYHLIMGGFAFGAVFMATDPVTASQTPRGKYIYGFLIGVLTVLIRVLNPAYPEGMMLAILLMNVFAPLIDHYVVEANMKRRLKRMKPSTVKVQA